MSRNFKLVVAFATLFWTLPMSGVLMVDNWMLGLGVYLTQVPICITLLKVFYKNVDDTE